jgi:hypothetical protein
MASSNTIDHTTLQRLVEAGAVRGAQVIGQPGGWMVMVRYGMMERPLASSKSKQVRLFRQFDTLVTYLRDIGIAKYDVDATHFDRDSLTARRNPSATARMRRAHASLRHDAWFREQVKGAVAEADGDVAWVDLDTANAEWKQDRIELESAGGRA